MNRSGGRHLGRCLCGNVQIEATDDPKWVGICHCGSCRRASGGALMAAAGFARSTIRISGASLAFFASSPGVRRSFCRDCGTSIYYENDRWPEDFHVMIGALDEPRSLTPTFHIFFEDRLPWIVLGDGLIRYRTTPSKGETMN